MTKFQALSGSVSLILCLGCVNLDQPKSVKECVAQGLCSNQGPNRSGGGTGNGSEAGTNNEVAVGGKDGSSTGGGIDVGGIASAGGATGAGGSTTPDGLANTGGTSGEGGDTSLDGSASNGGATSSVDGSLGAGGAPGSGGNSAPDSSISTGGALGSGGSSSVDGSTSTGGGSGGSTAPDGSTGGAIKLDGSAGAGGSTGTGGSSAGCGTTKSTLSQTFPFAAGLGSLVQSTSSTSGAKLASAIVGPTANSALCSSTAGCAALSMVFASGAAAYGAFALAVENFVPTANLVGSTVTFSLAVDNPGANQVPIQLQVFAQGDQASSYGWSVPTTVSGATLATYAPAAGFKDVVLLVANNSTSKYCAATTSAIGVQVQNTAAITSSNAGTVTVYIKQITITPPP